MLLVITKFIIGLIISTAVFLIVRNLVNNNCKIVKLKTQIALIIVALPVLLFYDTEYNSITTVLTFLIGIIVYKNLFKIKLSTAILAMSIAMILTAIADFIIIPLSIIVGYESTRNVWYISIISNIIVFVFSTTLSKINILKSMFQKFCLKIDVNSITSVIFFAIVSFWVLIVLFYNLSTHLELSSSYIITSIIITMLLVLYYLYVKECNSYTSLNQEYNTIFKYIQTFEDWIDNEQMYRHELKNNLSIIRNMTKNKEIIAKIDDMLKFSIILDENDIECLKDIPKGGLKGLIYYKIAISKNNNINIVTDVSPKISSKLKKINEQELKRICIILGIYIDNAIEASAKSKKKNLTLEIYMNNKELTFVISNTYKELIPIDKMNYNGYTTKGKGRGKGLYYVNKLLAKSTNLYTEQIFFNEYFVQKLYVKNI